VHLVSGLTFQLTTTARIKGEMTACFTIPWITDAASFERVRVLHLENGALVDRTILSPGSMAPDFARRRACALSTTTTQSSFAIGLRDAVPPGERRGGRDNRDDRGDRDHRRDRK